jgi:hypothetical protein
MKSRNDKREPFESYGSSNKSLTIFHSKFLHESALILKGKDIYDKLSLLGYVSSFMATDMSSLGCTTFKGAGDYTTY